MPLVRKSLHFANLLFAAVAPTLEIPSATAPRQIRQARLEFEVVAHEAANLPSGCEMTLLPAVKGEEQTPISFRGNGPHAAEVAPFSRWQVAPRCDGVWIPEVEVEIRASGEKLVVTPSGFFQFQGLGAGSYDLEVAHPGLATTSLTRFRSATSPYPRRCGSEAASARSG